jgi:hypothetical protein
VFCDQINVLLNVVLGHAYLDAGRGLLPTWTPTRSCTPPPSILRKVYERCGLGVDLCQFVSRRHRRPSDSGCGFWGGFCQGMWGEFHLAEDGSRLRAKVRSRSEIGGSRFGGGV